MTSFFVELEKNGFWAADELLRIWFYLLIDSVKTSKDNPEWLRDVSKQWAGQTQETNKDIIHIGLDATIKTLAQKQKLIKHCQEMLKTLPNHGLYLSKEKLNRLESHAGSGIVWYRAVSVGDLIDLCIQFIKLLGGDLYSTTANITAAESLEIVQQFLQVHCADADDIEELVNDLEMQTLVNAGPLVQGLKAIEQLLLQPPPDNILLKLVVEDANIKLDQSSPEQALGWLTWLTEQIRRELHDNLLPFQPMRAELIRIVAPDNERYPHDLLLYPTDEHWPEFWQTIWTKTNLFYHAFIKEWDGSTCPTCQTATIKRYGRNKLTQEIEHSMYSSTLYYDQLTVYECTGCHFGWTEQWGTTHHTEVEFPG